MPTIYAAGKCVVTVTLPKGNSTFQEWTDEDLIAGRREYEKPVVGLEFRIENPDDEISPHLIFIHDTGAYEGSLTVARKDRTFTFTLDGKFKCNVHKTTKPLIDAGVVPTFVGPGVCGCGLPGTTMEPGNGVRFSGKKL